MSDFAGFAAHEISLGETTLFARAGRPGATPRSLER